MPSLVKLEIWGMPTSYGVVRIKCNNMLVWQKVQSLLQISAYYLANLLFIISSIATYHKDGWRRSEILMHKKIVRDSPVGFQSAYHFASVTMNWSLAVNWSSVLLLWKREWIPTYFLQKWTPQKNTQNIIPFIWTSGKQTQPINCVIPLRW